MKVLLVLAACPLFLVSAPQAVARPTATIGEQQVTRETWRSNFAKSMKIGATAEMQRLVKKNDEFASEWIVETAEAIANIPSDELFNRMDAFRTAWRGAWGTEFCNKMEIYFSLLDPPTKRARTRLRSSFAKKSVLYHENMKGEKVTQKFTALGIEFEAEAQAFSDLGDNYYASRCYHFAANCYEEPALGKIDADLKRACKNYEKYFEACDKIELKDKLYLLTKERYDGLAGQGYGSQPKGTGGEGGAPGEPAAGKNAAGPVEQVTMEFDLVEKITGISRPSYFLDEIYAVWNAVSLNKKGSRTTISRLEHSPDILRVSGGDIQVDVDRDGEGDVKVPIKGRLDPVVFEIGEGAAKRKWAILVITGTETDTYQNVEMNLAPSEEVLTIYYVGGGSMVGEIGGTRVQIFDDNLDGIYGSPAVAYGHIGLTKDHYQPEMDSIRIGKSKHALPWSEYQKIGDTWYRLEVMDGGTHLTAAPKNLKTGWLKLKYKGPKASFMIVQGQNDYENSFFDLTSEKAVEVPVGRYRIYFGLVSTGKKRQLLKAAVVPSLESPTWSVTEPGEEVLVELGAPFGFDFDFDFDETTVTVHGNSVCVTGQSQERYERVWGAVPRPVVSYRVTGAKRGSRGEEMDVVQDQDLVFESWSAPWFPIDIVIDKRKKEAEIQVQLVQKKNKLFGNISSIWR